MITSDRQVEKRIHVHTDIVMRASTTRISSSMITYYTTKKELAKSRQRRYQDEMKPQQERTVQPRQTDTKTTTLNQAAHVCAAHTYLRVDAHTALAEYHRQILKQKTPARRNRNRKTESTIRDRHKAVQTESKVIDPMRQPSSWSPVHGPGESVT